MTRCVLGQHLALFPAAEFLSGRQRGGAVDARRDASLQSHTGSEYAMHKVPATWMYARTDSGCRMVEGHTIFARHRQSGRLAMCAWPSASHLSQHGVDLFGNSQDALLLLSPLVPENGNDYHLALAHPVSTVHSSQEACMVVSMHP